MEKEKIAIIKERTELEKIRNVDIELLKSHITEYRKRINQ